MSATTAPEAGPTVRLLQKLVEVAEAIPYVEKRGRNDHHGYDFVQALDVTRDVRAQLLARKILAVPSTVPGSVQHFTETGGKGFVTTVDLVYRFMDAETGASIEVAWTGAGADTGGDKGLYKAFTGGVKYALMQLFMLPATNDPEHDGISVTPSAAPSPAPAEEPQGTVAKDADRPAAPRIPLDRAKLILDAAKSARLATQEEGQAPSFSPVLKAKLATLGVAQIGQLDVDQAETIEAFIRAEVKA